LSGGPVRLEGVALHAGVRVAATLVARPGPLAFAQAAAELPLDALLVARADRGVCLAGDGVRVDLVEHLLAALAASGVRRGVVVRVDGPELPLLDGGAAAWMRAVAELALPAEPPLLAVARAGEVAIGDARYAFAPGEGVEVDVEIAFDHPAIGAQRASWRGDPGDFAARIAPARTFGFARDAAALRASGRAAGVDLDAVLVLGERGPLPGARPPGPDEPARHKLLDLVGDLALSGGPPRGRVLASRPGHAATHLAVREAFARGLLVRAAPA
jgi:UDP-3-O-[3-hydroxymyristoyl] N-acetylglucosamine deacetylase